MSLQLPGHSFGKIFYFNFFHYLFSVSRKLSQVKSKKGKQNMIFCHNPAPTLGQFLCFGGNTERTEKENRVMLWCLMSDHRESVAFLFAHWKNEEEYKSSPPLAKSTQRFLSKALMRKTMLLHANAFIKDGVR